MVSVRVMLLRHSTVLPQLSLPPPLDNEIPSVTQLEWLHPRLTQPEFPDPALNLIANTAKINGAMTLNLTRIHLVNYKVPH